MNKHATRGGAAHLMTVAAAAMILGEGAACNDISGINQIDFTDSTGDPHDGYGGAAGTDDTAGEGGAYGGAGGGAYGGAGGDAQGGAAGAGGDAQGGAAGAGGAPSTGRGPFEITCGHGNVVVGIFGRSGAWLDRLGLICAPLGGDGALGDPFQTEPVGGDGGQPGSAMCPRGQVVVGTERWSDSSRVYRIDLDCQTPAEWKASGNTAATVHGLGPESGTKGGFGCKDYHFGVAGEAGEYVYSIHFLCTAP